MTVPCNATSQDGNNTYAVGMFGDIGFTYGGGWNGDGSEALDMGLQYSAANQWTTPFYNAGGNEVIPSSGTHFGCGTPVEMEMFVVANAIIADLCQPSCAGAPQSLVSIAWMPPNFSSWYNNGETLKEMLTIGQQLNTLSDAYNSAGLMEDGYGFGMDQDGDPFTGMVVSFGSCTYTGAFPGNWSSSCVMASTGWTVNQQSFPDSNQVGTTGQGFSGNGNAYWLEFDAIQLYDWLDYSGYFARRLTTWPSSTPTPPYTPAPSPTPNICKNSPHLCL